MNLTTLLLSAAGLAPLAQAQTDAAQLAQDLDAAARARTAPVDEARRLGAAYELGADDWIDLATFEQLVWRGRGGFVESIDLGPEHIAIIEAGLAVNGADWDTIRQMLLQRTSTAPELAPSLRAAGRLAPEGDAPLFGELCAPFSATRNRGLRGALADAAAAWSARRAPRAAAVRSGLESVPRPFIASFVQGILREGSSEALTRGLACVGAVPAADTFLAAEIASVAERSTQPLDGLDPMPLLALITREDPSAAIEACRALRAMDAIAATHTLVAALEGPRHESVRTAVLDTLEHITLERLPRDAASWRTWQREEDAWVRDRMFQVLLEIESSNRQIQHRALLETARHRAQRHRTVGAVIKATRTDDPHVLTAAVATLGQLRTRTAILRLTQLLEHGELGVRRSAYQSLRFATGLDFGDDADRWRDEVLAQR